eukprot:gene6645-9431_t
MDTQAPDFIPLSVDDGLPAKRSKQKEKARRKHSKTSTGRDKNEVKIVEFPWMERSSYSKIPILELHQEILDFWKYMQPTKEEAALRQNFVDRVEQVVHELWPRAEVKVFGSFHTDLYLPTSDIDMVIFGDWPVAPLQTLERSLKKANIPDKTEVIAHARVPIVKFRDKVSNIWMDVSFNLPSGPEDSVNVKRWKKEHKSLEPLVIVLKQFLLQRGLNEPFTGGIGSYAVFLLVMSFLQRRSITCSSPNLGVLLIEFFELYGLHFNYSNVGISTSRIWRNKSQRDIICIENPRDPSQDVTGNAFQTTAIREAFRNAYYILTSNVHEYLPGDYQPPHSILGQIIQIDPDTESYVQTPNPWIGLQEALVGHPPWPGWQIS